MRPAQSVPNKIIHNSDHGIKSLTMTGRFNAGYSSNNYRTLYTDASSDRSSTQNVDFINGSSTLCIPRFQLIRP